MTEEPKKIGWMTVPDGAMITTMSHDPARRDEEPKDITDDLIKIILEANERCFPDKQ